MVDIIECLERFMHIYKLYKADPFWLAYGILDYL